MLIPKANGLHLAEELLHVAERERRSLGSKSLNIWQIVGHISMAMGL